jgi:3-oxoadipate enol-lactonase
MARQSRPEVYWRESGRGPALVLLNGWSASGLAWPRDWVRELEEHVRLIRIDNRGSGYSRHVPTPFTMADMADDVAAVLDATGHERATVAGLSMGGMVAQEFAMRHPDRLHALLLISTRPPTPAYVTPPGSSGSLEFLEPPHRGEPLDAYFTRLWSSATAPGFAEREPELIAELVAQIVSRPTSRQMITQQLRAVSGWGHADRLRSLTAPTTIVHGADDTMIDPANGRRLAELIDGARLVELSDVGHLPPLEAPTVLADLLIDAAAGGSALTVSPVANAR